MAADIDDSIKRKRFCVLLNKINRFKTIWCHLCQKQTLYMYSKTRSPILMGNRAPHHWANCRNAQWEICNNDDPLAMESPLGWGPISHFCSPQSVTSLHCKFPGLGLVDCATFPCLKSYLACWFLLSMSRISVLVSLSCHAMPSSLEILSHMTYIYLGHLDGFRWSIFVLPTCFLPDADKMSILVHVKVTLRSGCSNTGKSATSSPAFLKTGIMISNKGWCGYRRVRW